MKEQDMINEFLDYCGLEKGCDHSELEKALANKAIANSFDYIYEIFVEPIEAEKAINLRVPYEDNVTYFPPRYNHEGEFTVKLEYPFDNKSIDDALDLLSKKLEGAYSKMEKWHNEHHWD